MITHPRDTPTGSLRSSSHSLRRLFSRSPHTRRERNCLARDGGFLSYSPGSTQVHRHEALTLRFQRLSSITFEGCRHSVARTSQARLVVPPEPFDATGCQRVFRMLLQRPTRDQVFTAFVDIQDDSQHRRPSVRCHLRASSTPFIGTEVV